MIYHTLFEVDCAVCGEGIGQPWPTLDEALEKAGEAGYRVSVLGRAVCPECQEKK